MKALVYTQPNEVQLQERPAQFNDLLSVKRISRNYTSNVNVKPFIYTINF